MNFEFPLPFQEINIVFLILIFLILFGLCLGSFLNVVIYRLPLMMQQSFKAECESYLHPQLQTTTGSSSSYTLSKPRSACPSCNTPLSIWQNIPLFSFIWCKGKCAFCHSKISWQYPIIEICGAVFTVLVGCYYGFSIQGLGALIFCLTLLTLACIDFKHQLLPDILTLPLLWIGLLLNIYHTFVPLSDAVWGAILGYMVLWVFAKIFYFMTRKEGMAYGDMKLLAALGAWLGWKALLYVLLWASLMGSVGGLLWLSFTRKSRTTPIPFGPFLAVSGLIHLFLR